MSQDDTFTDRTYSEPSGGRVARNGPDPVLSRFGPYVPVPAFYFDILSELKPSTVVVLLIVLRQTLGWTDKQTGWRKEREWISQSQLALRSGLNRETVGIAVQALIGHGLVRAETEDEEPLHDPKARRRNRGRIYYRPVVPPGL